jgi:hypothetical protein
MVLEEGETPVVEGSFESKRPSPGRAMAVLRNYADQLRSVTDAKGEVRDEVKNQLGVTEATLRRMGINQAWWPKENGDLPQPLELLDQAQVILKGADEVREKEKKRGRENYQPKVLEKSGLDKVWAKFEKGADFREAPGEWPNRALLINLQISVQKARKILELQKIFDRLWGNLVSSFDRRSF